MAIWAISGPGGTGTSFDALGVTSCTGTFQAGNASTAKLVIGGTYQAEAWTADTLVTITRNGAPWFTGRVRASPASASGTSESIAVELVDEWESLHATTYEEPWMAGTTALLYPRVVLGQDPSTGKWIKTGEQIAAAITYAISQGIEIQHGVIGEGFQIWPSQADNISIADVIRKSLQFHPDWIAYLDHSAGQPSFNAIHRDDAITVGHSPAELESFECSPVEENMVRGVKIFYVSAQQGVTDVFRYIYVDSAGTVTTGRRVMSAVVDLAGVKAQYQKSRIQTRPLPGTQDDAKTYLQSKFPQLVGVAENAWTITKWKKTLVDEGTKPAPVSLQAPTLVPTDISHLPNELVNGSIEDWMRVKAGTVRIDFDYTISDSASAEDRETLNKFSSVATMLIKATNATTQLYTGLSSWVAADEVPQGIAGEIYSAASRAQYAGSLSIVGEELPGQHYVGCKIALAGFTTDAVVVSHSWDVMAGRSTVTFGASPFLGIRDMIDLQRMLHSRPANWYSVEERTSGKMGAQGSPGAQGDSVGGFDHPGTVTAGGTGTGRRRFEPYLVGGTKLYIAPGIITYHLLPYISGPTDDDGHREDTSDPVYLLPVLPKIGGSDGSGGAPLGSASAYFTVSSSTSGSIWVSYSSHDLDGETSEGTEEVVMLGADDQPEGQKGMTYLRICKFAISEGRDGNVLKVDDDAYFSDIIADWRNDNPDDTNGS